MGVAISINPKSLGVARAKLKRHAKQVPYALSRAINDSLFDGRKKAESDIKKYTDRPTPYSQRANMVVKSSKRRLYGRVGYRNDNRGKYLGRLVTGGADLPAGRTHAVPTRALGRNAYGNVTKGKQAPALLKSPGKYFSGKPKGRPNARAGVWERVNYTKGGRRKGSGTDQLRLVHAYKPVTNYRKQIPFYRSTKKAVRGRLGQHFRKHFAKAIATAR